MLLVAWAVINLGYFGFQYAKFMRYFLPVYPALAVLAAYLLVLGASAGCSRRAPAGPQAAARDVTPVVLGVTVLLRAGVPGHLQPAEHPRQASEWIYKNIPHGTPLGLEHWDDGAAAGAARLRARVTPTSR